jgi:His-Xaa-Ser system protein HxsD
MTLKTQIDQKKNQITFWLNTKTYPLEAIYSTAYVFLDRAYIYLDGDPKKEIQVSLKGKNKLTKKELENLAGEFQNELLNYLLRVEIGKRTKKIREFIVGTALVSSLPKFPFFDEASYLETYGEEEKDWQNDPLGIAIPWEEKYKKKKKK